jgi:hypothetical protein
MYKADQAVWARAFTDWLTAEYGADVPNVFSFDLFGIIADPESHGTRTEFQRADRPGDSHPNEVANRTAAKALVPFLNRAVRAAGLVR